MFSLATNNAMKCIIFLLLCGLIFYSSCQKTGIAKVDGTQIAIFNEAPHNAFTDLIKYNDNYFCVFREASTHDSYDSKLRVIQSFNGNKWTDFSLLSVEGRDVRDPHFYIDNNNVLSIGTSGRNARQDHENISFKLINGSFVQSLPDSADNDYWLWSFAKSNNVIYSIGYNLRQYCFNDESSSKPKISLFVTSNLDCTTFSDITSSSWINSKFKCPAEASMIFINDTTMVAAIRDEHTPGLSHIGIASKPFKEWHWQDFPYFLRGPKLALLPDGKFFLAAASMVDYNKTYYAILNPEDFSVEKIRAFPSGGDCGYPGVIIEGNTALVSYYSSHEGNARIYIERITY